jgi:hypothetical protein
VYVDGGPGLGWKREEALDMQIEFLGEVKGLS